MNPENKSSMEITLMVIALEIARQGGPIEVHPLVQADPKIAQLAKEIREKLETQKKTSPIT